MAGGGGNNTYKGPCTVIHSATSPSFAHQPIAHTHAGAVGVTLVIISTQYSESLPCIILACLPLSVEARSHRIPAEPAALQQLRSTRSTGGDTTSRPTTRNRGTNAAVTDRSIGRDIQPVTVTLSYRTLTALLTITSLV